MQALLTSKVLCWVTWADLVNQCTHIHSKFTHTINTDHIEKYSHDMMMPIFIMKMHQPTPNPYLDRYITKFLCTFLGDLLCVHEAYGLFIYIGISMGEM